MGFRRAQATQVRRDRPTYERRLAVATVKRAGSRASRRFVGLLALVLLAVTLLPTHVGAGDPSALRPRITGLLNTAIAWSDLNLGLWPRQGARRAVRLDPTLRTGLASAFHEGVVTVALGGCRGVWGCPGTVAWAAG